LQPNLSEAERRIEEARSTQAETLDLGDLSLRKFPASLGDLPYLKALYLGMAGPTAVTKYLGTRQQAILNGMSIESLPPSSRT